MPSCPSGCKGRCNPAYGQCTINCTYHCCGNPMNVAVNSHSLRKTENIPAPARNRRYHRPAIPAARSQRKNIPTKTFKPPLTAEQYLQTARKIVKHRKAKASALRDKAGYLQQQQNKQPVTFGIQSYLNGISRPYNNAAPAGHAVVQCCTSQYPAKCSLSKATTTAQPIVKNCCRNTPIVRKQECHPNCAGKCDTGSGPCAPGCTYPCGGGGGLFDRFGNPCQPDCLYCPEPIPGYAGHVPQECFHGWRRGAKQSPTGVQEAQGRTADGGGMANYFGRNQPNVKSGGDPMGATHGPGGFNKGVGRYEAQPQQGYAPNGYTQPQGWGGVASCGAERCDPRRGPCLPGCQQGSPCYAP